MRERRGKRDGERERGRERERERGKRGGEPSSQAFENREEKGRMGGWGEVLIAKRPATCVLASHHPFGR